MISPHTTPLAVLCCIALAASTSTDSAAQPCVPPLAVSDELLYQSFESMHKWVGNELNAKSENLKQKAAQTLAKQQETIQERMKQQLDTLQQAMKSEMSELQGQLSEMSNVGTQVNALKEQITSGLVKQNQQIQHQMQQQIQQQCVTDIKFISINRRMVVSFLKNNVWTPVH